MKLGRMLAAIHELDGNATIMATLPWDSESEAILVQSDPEGRLAGEAAHEARGYRYFLEVSVALEVLEVFAGRSPTQAQVQDTIIHYAGYDCWPDWVDEID